MTKPPRPGPRGPTGRGGSKRLVPPCPRCGERRWRDEIDEMTAPDHREADMTDQYIECATLCPLGHRGYQRIYGVIADDLPGVRGRCGTCGEPARLTALPPPTGRGGS